MLGRRPLQPASSGLLVSWRWILQQHPNATRHRAVASEPGTFQERLSYFYVPRLLTGILKRGRLAEVSER